MKKEYIQVLTTVNTKELAHKIANLLIDKKAASCVQIIPIESFYRWKDNIKNSNEFLCIVKGKNFELIKDTILEVHPYVLPEIIEVPISKGYEKYLTWLDSETK